MTAARLSILALGLALTATACNSSAPGVTCGPDTVERSNTCVALPECGAGTHLVGLRCVLDPMDGGLDCAPGTHLEDQLCVPDQPDGGLPGATSWSTNVHVTAGFAWAGEPEVAIDSQGRIFVAAMSNRNAVSAESVALFRSTDHGRTFEVLGEQHPAANQFLGDTTVVVDGTDRLFWGWTVYDFAQPGGIEVAMSLDGDTLGAPQWVSDVDPSNPFCDRPWLSVNPHDDSTFVSWTNGPQDFLQGARFNVSMGGQPFGHPQQTVAPPSSSITLLEESPLAFDASGLLVAGATVFGGGTGGITEVLRQSGGAFVPSRVSVLNPSQAVVVDRYVNLRSDSAGHLTLVYLDLWSRRVGVYAAHSDDGVAWTVATAINEGTDASNAALPWITTDSRNRVHALWLDNRSGAWVPYTAISADGITFGQVERVGDAQFVEDGTYQRWIGDFNSIVVRDGTRYAVWTDTREGVSQVYFSSAPDPP